MPAYTAENSETLLVRYQFYTRWEGYLSYLIYWLTRKPVLGPDRFVELGIYLSMYTRVYDMYIGYENFAVHESLGIIIKVKCTVRISKVLRMRFLRR